MMKLLVILLLNSLMTYTKVEVHNHTQNKSFPAINKCYVIEKTGTLQLSKRKGYIIIDGKRRKGNVHPIFKENRIIGYKVTRFGIEKIYYF